MKKKRWIAVLLVIAVAVSTFVIYNILNPTALGLMRRMARNMEKIQSVKSTVVMDYDGEVATGLGNLAIGLDADFDLESVTSTGVSHMDGTIRGSLFGLSLDMPVESYVETDGETLVTYTSASGQQWIKSTSKTGENAQSFKPDEKTILGLLQKIKDKEITAELAKETEKIGDKEVYRIDIKAKGDLIGELIRMAAASGEQTETAKALQNADFSGADTNLVLYLYKDSKLPARAQVDCTALGSILIREQLKEKGIDVRTERFMITVDFTEYNTIESLEIPAEVKSTAIEGEVDLIDEMMP
ncbi:MAG TPA: hypothetical protein DCF49_07740 [Lachnospiraceae bacterium]|nr:hypothetical protein [Lachnospiraceae bacterium]